MNKQSNYSGHDSCKYLFPGEVVISQKFVKGVWPLRLTTIVAILHIRGPDK